MIPHYGWEWWGVNLSRSRGDGILDAPSLRLLVNQRKGESHETAVQLLETLTVGSLTRCPLTDTDKLLDPDRY